MNVETLPDMLEPQNGLSLYEAPALDYHPMPAKRAIRVKARIRSITTGKPGRYDLPEEK